jgi:hypothetical protein
MFLKEDTEAGGHHSLSGLECQAQMAALYNEE